MVKPLDLTRFKREQLKKNGIKSGFFDPLTWIDTGNFALNKRISDDFAKGVPLGDVTVFAGESGSGKSYIVSGNIVKHALAMGVTVVLIDSEGALKAQWMKNLGVDPDHPQLVRFPASTIDEVAGLIRDAMGQYMEDNKELPREQQHKLLFVIDSLGFLGTKAEVDQFDRGELKGDKGIKAKALKALVSQCIRLFNGNEVGLVATNHTYKSQDMYSPDDVVSGGAGFVFAASILVTMNKRKLKEDEFGNKITEVTGIRAAIKCVKSRYAKPFEDVEVRIPYDRGMDPYSGLFDMFEKKGILVKTGNRYAYTDGGGTEHKQFRKEMKPEFFQLLMDEYQDERGDTGIDETPADLDLEGSTDVA